MKYYFLIPFVFGWMQLVSAQDTQDSTKTSAPAEVSMITNRPGFTEASRAVFKSGFQIETGFQYSKTPTVPKSEGSSDYQENVLIPNLGLLYGISTNVEIRIFANYEGQRISPFSSEYTYDFNNLLVGTKINLTEAKGLVPEMALLVTLGIPTNKLNAKVWPATALLAWSYSLPANFGLSGNLSYGYDMEFEEHYSVTHPHHINYTINLGYGITDKLSTYAELYGYNTLGSGNNLDVKIAGGFYYRINPKFQVDLIGGYGIEDKSYLANAGFSWLLLK